MAESDCGYVHFINRTEDQCVFVMGNADCQEATGFLNYVQLVYCKPGQGHLAAVMICFVLWLAFLFVGLAIAADKFFCPNLATISKTLRLSHNIAGITIVSFGNGAPDIFSSFASVSQSRPQLLLGELFGAGLFVVTVVAGSICLARPFKLMERPFLRDIIFYLAAGFWAFCIFYRGQVRLLDALGFLALYIGYLLVVVVGRMVYQRLRRSQSLLSEDHDDGVDDLEQAGFYNVFVAPLPSPEATQPHLDDHVAEPGSTPRSNSPNFVPAAQWDLATMPSPEEEGRSPDCCSPWRQLLQAVWPFTTSYLRSPEIPMYMKVWSLVTSPFFLAFTITIPVVEMEPDQPGDQATWSQYLHAVQCIVAPQFVTFAIGYGLRIVSVDPDDNFHLWEIMLVLGLIGVIVVLCTTSPTQPPRFRSVFAFLGFAVCVVWIYAIANEVVALIKAFGVVFGLSDAILGLTVLAWGNSLSDLIADVAVARRGFPRMGFSACFGGPLFNLLLGIGLPLSIAIIRKGQPIEVDYSPMVLTLSAALGTALITSFIMFPLCSFQAGRVNGFVLLALYVALMCVAIALEFHFNGG